MKAKVVTVKKLMSALANARRKGKRIVFTNGCFDIIHAGHIAYLEKARRLGDLLVVGLNSDASVRRLKGNARPINRQGARAAVLAGLSSVDFVTVFADDTPARLITAVHPDVLAKGGDWRTGDIVGSAFVRSYGGHVARVPFVKGYSTTSLIERLSA